MLYKLGARFKYTSILMAGCIVGILASELEKHLLAKSGFQDELSLLFPLSKNEVSPCNHSRSTGLAGVGHFGGSFSLLPG